MSRRMENGEECQEWWKEDDASSAQLGQESPDILEELRMYRLVLVEMRESFE